MFTYGMDIFKQALVAKTSRFPHAYRLRGAVGFYNL